MYSISLCIDISLSLSILPFLFFSFNLSLLLTLSLPLSLSLSLSLHLSLCLYLPVSLLSPLSLSLSLSFCHSFINLHYLLHWFLLISSIIKVTKCSDINLGKHSSCTLSYNPPSCQTLSQLQVCILMEHLQDYRIVL